MTAKVWSLGDAVVDLIPQEDGAFRPLAGGAPANVAVAIARLGAKVGFIGRVGADPFGYFLRETLEQEQVDTSALTHDPEHLTSTVLVTLDKTGERSFTFLVKPAADQFLTVADLPAFQAGDWLHFCSIGLISQSSREAIFTAIQQLKAVGGYVSFDPNLRPALWCSEQEMLEVCQQALEQADVVKFSEVEIPLFAENCADYNQAFAQLTAKYPHKLICITKGGDGVDFSLKGNSISLPSQKVNVVDTTGAGDAFVGGLLAELSQLAQFPEQVEQVTPCVQTAIACGGYAVTAKGAMTALPTREQLA